MLFTQNEIMTIDENLPDILDNDAEHGSEDSAISFAEMLDNYEYPQPERGDIIQGEVLRIEDDVLYVDIGAKRDAMVPYDEVVELDPDFLDSISTGDTVPVYVTRTPIGDEALVVSIEKGLEQRDWEQARALMESDETIDCEVVGHNKGGLIVQFGRIRGFVPNSHEPELRRIRSRSERTSYKARIVGETLTLKVIEIDRQRERLVLSATAAQKELREEQLDELTAGETVVGHVVHLTDYGAFVDLGHVTGLLHVSKIAWEHVEHPSEVLSVGDEIEVLIDEVDYERERISLNRRALLPSPWERFEREHQEGELIEGVVTALTDFGAFVLVAEGIEGLIHVSEISSGHVETPGSVLQVGDTVLTRIISIETDRKRLGLSMRRVSSSEEMEWMMHQKEEQEAAALAAAEAESEAPETESEEVTTETAVDEFGSTTDTPTTPEA